MSSVAFSGSDRRLKRMIAAQLLWLTFVGMLIAWWGRLVLTQAGRIAELESLLGRATLETASHWRRTQRMLYWEGGAFFLLLLVSTGALIWLYWRDGQRAKGTQAFFASVSHELRTPLTSIRLQAESMAENLASAASVGASKQAILVRRLLDDTIRLENQVERTLELARLEGGGPVHAGPLLLKPWIDQFLSHWSEAAGAGSGPRVDFKVAVEDVQVHVDASAMHVIFKNLLENSMKHSEADFLCIDLRTEMSEGGIRLVIKDNGKGFVGNPSTLGQIFQKGQCSNGTGVGLYLVKTLMTRMGGTVQFGLSHQDTLGFEVALLFREGP